MPGFDGTGPRGLGPGTGWGLGPCGAGMRRGFARGFGRGFRRTSIAPTPVTPIYQQPTKEQETQMLEQEAKAIEEEQKELNKELEEVKKRINELNTQQ